ncbi:hypothetical protein ACH5RR_020750 [Cinchona calisaya]|uniref:Uncharacterized protein n=1 Tax=Cinchona calisaya TaxID=153742 RepID=A0ABD2ZFF0_9GENT
MEKRPTMHPLAITSKIDHWSPEKHKKLYVQHKTPKFSLRHFHKQFTGKLSTASLSASEGPKPNLLSSPPDQRPSQTESKNTRSRKRGGPNNLCSALIVVNEQRPFELSRTISV